MTDLDASDLPPLPPGFRWGRYPSGFGRITVTIEEGARWVAHGDPTYWGGYAAAVGAHRLTAFRRVFRSERQAAEWIARWVHLRAEAIRAEVAETRPDPSRRLGYGPGVIPWQRGGVRPAPWLSRVGRK